MNESTKQNTAVAILSLLTLILTMFLLISISANRDLSQQLEKSQAATAKQKAWRDYYQWRDSKSLGHSASPDAYPKYYELYPNDNYVAPEEK